MAVLKIYKQSQVYREVQLVIGQEYTIGRGEECDIALDPERGVSRNHLKLVPEGETWRVDVLSRFGELYVGREKVSGFNLTDGFKFLVPPYEFEFIQNAEQQASVSQSHSTLEPISKSNSFDDRTHVGVFQSTPFLKVVDPRGELFQVFRLEGHVWQAGRDMACSVFIDNQKFSRKHFEIQNQEGAYLIRDLGSSNGTLRNGVPISQDWTRIESGDIISVVDWTLQFELRDAAYEQRLQEVSDEFKSPVIYDPHAFASPQQQYSPDSSHYGQATGFPPAYDPALLSQKSSAPGFSGVKNMDRTKLIRIVMGVLVVGATLFYFMDSGDSGSRAPANTSAKIQGPFEKLSAQQKQYVKDTYRLADSLFKQGRYEMARQEIAKIHLLIPYFEESKNIEQLASVAIQTQIDQQKADAREQDRLEMEQKIIKTVAECRSKINSNMDAQKMDQCLSPVIVLNPEHPQIIAIKSEVDQLAADRMMKQEQKEEYLASLRRQKGLFDKAEKINSEGNKLEALIAYETVVKSSLPDPQDYKGKSRRQIASIKDQISEKQASFKKKADTAAQKGDLKEAIKSLQGALKIDPNSNEIKDRIDSHMRDLRKNMQTLYQEGVLEESIGEVDTAKAKWKKIIDSSVPEEEYFKKAKSKLKKYGAF